MKNPHLHQNPFSLSPPHKNKKTSSELTSHPHNFFFFLVQLRITCKKLINSEKERERQKERELLTFFFLLEKQKVI